MASYPDDVLLVIFGHTDLDTFLELGLLNRKMSELIDSHIHGLTDAVARSSFPRQTRLLADQPTADGHDAIKCLEWLKDLRYGQLAAIMLECRAEHSIAADDPLGDELLLFL